MSGASTIGQAAAVTAGPAVGGRGRGMSADPALTPESINVHGVSRLTSIPVRTLRRRDAAGTMPAPIRAGRRVYWRTEDIRLWVRLGFPDRKEFEKRRAALERAGG